MKRAEKNDVPTLSDSSLPYGRFGLRPHLKADKRLTPSAQIAFDNFFYPQNVRRKAAVDLSLQKDQRRIK